MSEETRPPETPPPAPPPSIGEPGEHPLSVLLFSWMRGAWFDRAFLAAMAGLCALLAALELIVDRHAEGVEAVPAFYGVFGFLAFALAVLSGWPLGKLLRRPEAYYEPDVEADAAKEAANDD